MSLWKIALRSVLQRGVASVLTTLSMSLGVMLVVVVLTVHGVVTEQFRSNASLGYNMLIGAKGGKLQLTLNSVFYLSQPIENVDYSIYLEFFDQETRQTQLKNSFAYESHQALSDTLALEALGGGLTPGVAPLGISALSASRESERMETFELDRRGQFGRLTKFAIPLCLGDYFGRFRVVGTTSAMFNDLVVDLEDEAKFDFSEGRNFEEWTPEHGYFEAVVGSIVAREMGVAIGDEINPAHGDPEGHGHENAFTVVGILAPSGTPNDRAVFVNMEGFFLMADHIKPLETPKTEDDEEDANAGAEAPDQPTPAELAELAELAERRAKTPKLELTPLPLEQREVTAILVRTVNPFVAAGMHTVINDGGEAQAVQPVKEIYDLLDLIVAPVQMALLGMTVMICIVSGVSILVSIYNSMNDRRHEIAVMRSLGASRNTVMSVILLEAIFLSLAGGVVGWVLGHSLNAGLSSVIEGRTGVTIGFFDLAPEVDVLSWLGVDFSRFPLPASVAVLLPATLGMLLLATAHVDLVNAAIQRRETKWWTAMLIFPPLAAWFGLARKRGSTVWWLAGFVLTLAAAVAYKMEADDKISAELLLVPGLMLLAVVVGFFPAISAYRTDVAESLGK
ncbi:MAG: ABC transporter permease [Pirellulaceae bacterium]|nr:ABC transporter permease [Pirellulaceae bacterium]